MFYLLLLVLVILLCGKTGKLLAFGLAKSFLFIVIYLSVPLIILLLRF